MGSKRRGRASAGEGTAVAVAAAAIVVVVCPWACIASQEGHREQTQGCWAGRLVQPGRAVLGSAPCPPAAAPATMHPRAGPARALSSLCSRRQTERRCTSSAPSSPAARAPTASRQRWGAGWLVHCRVTGSAPECCWEEGRGWSLLTHAVFRRPAARPPSNALPHPLPPLQYKINDRAVGWEQYNSRLERYNILVKARNFLVFQVRAALRCAARGARGGCCAAAECSSRSKGTVQRGVRCSWRRARRLLHLLPLHLCPSISCSPLPTGRHRERGRRPKFDVHALPLHLLFSARATLRTWLRCNPAT